MVKLIVVVSNPSSGRSPLQQTGSSSTMTLPWLLTLKRTFLICQRKRRKTAVPVTPSVPYSVKCGLNFEQSTDLEYEVFWGGEGTGWQVAKIRL